MAAAVAKHLDHQVRCAIHHLWKTGKPRNRIDQPEQPDTANDTIEISFTGVVGLGDEVQACQTSRVIGGFLANFTAHLANRSGSTVAAGLFAGCARERVGRFAFLMALVPILGSAVLGLRDVAAESVPVGPLVLGCVVAFASGLLALKVLLGFVARGRMALFAPYCVVVGVLAIWA